MAPNTLRELLITHFSVSYRLGRVLWPRHMKKSSRVRLGRPNLITEPAAILRALSIIRDSLKIAPSCLRRIGSTPGVYHDVIGNGLFTNMLIRKNEIIAEFIGEFITKEEATRRIDQGLGGYMIRVRSDVVLDSYPYLNVCKASIANSPYQCLDITTNSRAKANAKLVNDTRRRKYRLVSIEEIPPGAEILWDYGKDYKFPDLLL